MSNQKLYRFSCMIWENAEHWQFEAFTDALSQGAAFNQFRADYPKKDYRCGEVRLDNTYMPNFE